MTYLTRLVEGSYRVNTTRPDTIKKPQHYNQQKFMKIVIESKTTEWIAKGML
jgi:hypothetical protein